MRERDALAMAKRACVPPAMRGQLRDMFFLGDTNVTGDPLRALSAAIDAARDVMAAKLSPRCRFKAAEVDVMVARELRQISEAAERARRNLAKALEVMA